MKSFKKSLLYGVTIGILMVVTIKTFNIDPELVKKNYLWVAITIIALVAGINLGYNIIYMNKMKKLMPLFSQKRYKDFVTEVDKLLLKAKGNYLRSVLKINQSSAYINLDEFNKAENVLKSIDIGGLKSDDIQIIYWINMCTLKYNKKNFDGFRKSYEEGKKVFEKYKDNPHYRENIMRITMNAKVVDKKFDEAQAILDNLKETYKTEELKKEYDRLQKTLDDIKNKSK